MSGGVDSSVAALLLRDAGEPLAGLFMQNWADDGSGDCRAEDDRRDAVAVCGRLGIPFHFRNFSGEYWDGVFEHFLAEYAAGRTPNPDVLCNREIKFKHFLDAARELGAEFIATGHYARVDQRRRPLAPAARRRPQQGPELLPAPARPGTAGGDPVSAGRPAQDATCAASPREAGLPTARQEGFHRHLLHRRARLPRVPGRYLPARAGEIRTPDGARVGEHPGVFYFTLGQREGLNIGGVRGFEPAPWYVVGKDVAQQRAVRRPGHRQPLAAVAARSWSEAAHWIAGAPPAARFDCTAQTRYRQADEACEVTVARRRHAAGALRRAATRGHAGAVGGALPRRRMPRRRGDRRHRCAARTTHEGHAA